MEGIRRDGSIWLSRGEPPGIDVEGEPFGTLIPFLYSSPKEETGAYGRGAYVEFDLPESSIPQPWVGRRRSFRIPSGVPFSIRDLNPVFVTVRWWEIWNWWNT